MVLPAAVEIGFISERGWGPISQDPVRGVSVRYSFWLLTAEM